METRPIASTEEALLRMINASQTCRLALDELMDDSGMSPDEDMMDSVKRAKLDEDAALAHLNAVAPKCPGCGKAFAFQRQPKHPNRCSFCGYDHDTGRLPGLVPA